MMMNRCMPRGLTINSELMMSAEPMTRTIVDRRSEEAVVDSGDIFESKELMQGESRWRSLWGEVEK
jgi:hypothetical protein